MNMQATYGYRTIKCDVEADKDLSIYTAHPVDLCDDAICYAVRRFLCRSKTICKEFVKESYALRVEKGGGKRRKRRRVIAPAAAAEMGFGWAVIDLCISPAGVTVKRIALLDRYPVK